MSPAHSDSTWDRWTRTTLRPRSRCQTRFFGPLICPGGSGLLGFRPARERSRSASHRRRPHRVARCRTSSNMPHPGMVAVVQSTARTSVVDALLDSRPDEHVEDPNPCGRADPCEHAASNRHESMTIRRTTGVAGPVDPLEPSPRPKPSRRRRTADRYSRAPTDPASGRRNYCGDQ